MDKNWFPKDFKVIRDSVHGDIVVEEKYLKIINTPEFQRLRRIRQLSVANIVFPSADHTRFSHSLGTFHVMKKIIKQISEQFKALNIEINERDKEIAIVSALVHDIGHGPFSHAFEDLIPNAKKSHEEWTVDIIKSKKTKINEIMKITFDIKFPDDVARILRKENIEEDSGIRYIFFDVLSSLISSQIDADRLDYLVRDSFNTGVKFGNIDLDRIISSINITAQNGKYCVYIPEKYLVDIEEYLFSRYQMNKSVYFHPTKVELEEIIKLIFKRINELKNEKKLEYIPDIIERTLSNNLDASTYCLLDEDVLINAFHEWSFSKDKILSRLCRAYLDRDKYKKIKILDGSNENIEKFKLDLIKLLNGKTITKLDISQSFFWIEKKIQFTMYKTKKENILVLDKNGKLVDFSEISKVFSKSDQGNINEFTSNYTYIDTETMKYYYKKFSETDLIDINNLINKYDTRNYIEIENKYLVKSYDFDQIDNYLQKKYGKDFIIGEKKEQIDTYYDTLAHEFYSSGETLRIRELNSKYIFTIKTPVSDSGNILLGNENERFEYEQEIVDNNIEKCKDLIQEKSSTKIDINTQFIIPLIVIKNNRRKSILKYLGAIFEISYDDFIYYDSKNNVLFEVGKERQIEIELKSAYSKKLVLNKFCQEFEKEFDQLTYTTDSKLKIGIEILKRKNKE